MQVPLQPFGGIVEYHVYLCHVPHFFATHSIAYLPQLYKLSRLRYPCFLPSPYSPSVRCIASSAAFILSNSPLLRRLFVNLMCSSFPKGEFLNPLSGACHISTDFSCCRTICA